jgi:serine/threonine-protein kinase
LFHREREVDTIRAVLSAPVPPPNAIRSGIPREIEDITMHALQRDPSRRFQSAHELAAALDGLRGKRDAIATQAALATWLRQLFPDLYARRLELVDQVRQMSEGSVPRISRALAEPSLDTRPMAEASASLQQVPRRHRRAWLIAGAALLGCALGGAGWLALRTPDTAPATPAAPTLHVAAIAAPAPIAVPTPSPLPQAPVLPAPPVDDVASDPAPVLEAHSQSAAARRTPSGHGSVNVATPGGWADVFVAGRHRGRTPLQLELPEGKRVLVLKPFGAKPVKRFVIVRRDQLTRLVVPIAQKP